MKRKSARNLWGKSVAPGKRDGGEKQNSKKSELANEEACVYQRRQLAFGNCLKNI
jgi:hypothetical protein